MVLAYPSQDAGCQMLNVLHHQKKLKMDLKKQCDYRKMILLAPEEYVGDNKFKVQEGVKLQERESLIEIPFPSLQIDSMRHLPDQLLAPGGPTLWEKGKTSNHPPTTLG